MAEGEDKDSKTEEPTEKKIRDAVDKGNVPFSREVPVFASILGMLIFLVFFLPLSAGRFVESLRDLFEQADGWRLTTGGDAVALFQLLFFEAGAVLLPAFALLMGFGIAASVLQNMPSPVLDRIQPKLERISIAKGFGRIYGVKGMVEFAKSMSKIVIVSMIVAFVMQGEFFRTLDFMFMDPTLIAPDMARLASKVIIVVLLCTATLAILDLLWTRYSWHADLRMSKQDLKDELKQSDGDPILKARQRSLARDRARRRMIAEVPRATLVIANPTHYAVALRYVREEGGAPVVVAKGQDLIALKIREVAEAHGIPVFEDPPLARSMFAQVSVDNFIPAVFYKAVAELVHRIYAVKSKSKGSLS
ncbi:MAG: flagellar biosynthesis protein FlhB [Hoeflea sp.]|uniref:flagellar biosynthesis protein FlhB n=1 Tax=Hoeflea sp. TaxID=1940281 RepID=UPI001DF440F9|nr:flagellar biosynthesis protein FlhB [Hoeflea sp.]MBU4531138.1 flagellar biosynthesis protein FlhB [Alphaproteobacteria bacterium]MBU4545800.1 flagellar biosynthesis protein FlhB [Alphaproteobacteria bacterium]MBU4550769.1 flagellar biosynthesis protein FlhB [Alphaproteobacteria bacterium]MBV1724415.1 flagellar biosynthesis protein FlhB [Hoeflea sp.]MBV1760435.1 flagellar biosynthesis protein FlhB [Hoeflea sp.]